MHTIRPSQLWHVLHGVLSTPGNYPAVQGDGPSPADSSALQRWALLCCTQLNNTQLRPAPLCVTIWCRPTQWCGHRNTADPSCDPRAATTALLIEKQPNSDAPASAAAGTCSRSKPPSLTRSGHPQPHTAQNSLDHRHFRHPLEMSPCTSIEYNLYRHYRLSGQ